MAEKYPEARTDHDRGVAIVGVISRATYDARFRSELRHDKRYGGSFDETLPRDDGAGQGRFDSLMAKRGFDIFDPNAHTVLALRP